MDVVKVLIGQVGIPLVAVLLVVAAIAVVTHHLSKPKPAAPSQPDREFISDHPVGGPDAKVAPDVSWIKGTEIRDGRLF